jgi:hypothetical protein
MRFLLLAGRFAVCRFAADAQIPAWISSGNFVSITRTTEELSIVCPEPKVPPDTNIELGWACLKLEGPFPFAQTGVLASFIAPLSGSQIPIFAISTFNTDYVLVKFENIEQALAVLKDAGYDFVE